MAKARRSSGQLSAESPSSFAPMVKKGGSKKPVANVGRSLFERARKHLTREPRPFEIRFIHPVLKTNHTANPCIRCDSVGGHKPIGPPESRGNVVASIIILRHNSAADIVMVHMPQGEATSGLRLLPVTPEILGRDSAGDGQMLVTNLHSNRRLQSHELIQVWLAAGCSVEARSASLRPTCLSPSL
ncbi:hypothetical protein SODALDRAFT_357705 [Sodiomyces alkalinus F11]|uniref:Uncharacterized protein n=1 Tax=Sodiomyces alkalinus (strain CBS 110278 / VKM F-3762 / F11) TaxID=1314773 RepID=A0A3N2Q4E2_SODAK|nr:hypothetical protein SODALDRAFT_357705 [Sodiomyces alkalinus F11]ROT41641.1 hypothetical protein SODALDRAFT_357705 [Sodiomyces alkalinus F11]